MLYVSYPYVNVNDWLSPFRRHPKASCVVQYDLNPHRERRIQPSSDQGSTPASPASPEDDSAAGARCSPDDPTCCASNTASGHLHGRQVSSELNCDGRFNHSAAAHIYAISEDEDVCPTCLEGTLACASHVIHLFDQSS